MAYQQPNAKIVQQPKAVQGNPDWQEVRFDKMMSAAQLAQMMAQLYPGQAGTAIAMRVCDSCEQPSDAQNVSGHCQKCDTGFDLCGACQKDPLNITTECPRGYGCKSAAN